MKRYFNHTYKYLYKVFRRKDNQKLFSEAYKCLGEKIILRDGKLLNHGRIVDRWFLFSAIELAEGNVTIVFPSGEEYEVSSKEGRFYHGTEEISFSFFSWVMFLKAGNDPWGDNCPPMHGYHATWGCNIPSILKEGLIPGKKRTYSFSNKEVVCFSEYRNTCYEMLEESAFNGCSNNKEIESGMILLEISPFFLWHMQEEIYEDPNDRTGSSQQIHNYIPPEAIRVVE